MAYGRVPGNRSYTFSRDRTAADACGASSAAGVAEKHRSTAIPLSPFGVGLAAHHFSPTLLKPPKETWLRSCASSLEHGDQADGRRCWAVVSLIGVVDLLPPRRRSYWQRFLRSHSYRWRKHCQVMPGRPASRAAPATLTLQVLPRTVAFSRFKATQQVAVLTAARGFLALMIPADALTDRKSTRLNSSH
jgi:hypothetical protein